MPQAQFADTPSIDRDKPVTRGQVMEWLENSPVFEGLSRTDLERFLPSLQIMNFNPLDEVIGEGQVSAALYIIVDGRFLVLLSSDCYEKSFDGASTVQLDTFEPGDCFGEYSLIDRKPASASVVSAQEGRALRLPRHVFESVLMSDYRIAKTVYFNLLQVMTGRLRRANRV